MSITPRLQDLPEAELVNHLMTHTNAGALLRANCGEEPAQEFIAEPFARMTTNRQLRDAAKLAGERFFTPIRPCAKCACNLYYASMGYSGTCRDCAIEKAYRYNGKARVNKSGRKVAPVMVTCHHCKHEQVKKRGQTYQSCTFCCLSFSTK